MNFYEGENKISVSDYRDLLSSDKSNLSKSDSGMGDLKTSQIISAIGGGLIGWPIGQSLANNPFRKPAWWMAGVGAGAILIAIPISTGGYKKMRDASGNYNEGLGIIDSIPKYEIQFVGQDGVGFVLIF